MEQFARNVALTGVALVTGVLLVSCAHKRELAACMSLPTEAESEAAFQRAVLAERKYTERLKRVGEPEISRMSAAELQQILFSIPHEYLNPRIGMTRVPENCLAFSATQAVVAFNQANKALRFELSGDGRPKQFQPDELIFGARAMRDGIYYHIMPTNNAYSLYIDYRRIELFVDHRLSAGEPIRLQALRYHPDYLNTNTAKVIAAETLQRLGFSPSQIASLGTLQVTKSHMDKETPLAQYRVRFVKQEEPAINVPATILEFQIVGTVPGGRIVRFSDSSKIQPVLPLPDYYSQQVETWLTKRTME